MTETLEKVRSRGHWEVTIRPTNFIEKRVPNVLDLRRIVERASVQLRGWDYPHVEANNRANPGVDWMGDEVDWDQYIEFWRLYQSGLFFHTFAMHEDWQDQARWGKDAKWQAGEVLLFLSTLFTFTEIFAFAARLSSTEAGDEQMHISVSVKGLSGRRLFNDAGGFPFRSGPATVAEFTFESDYSRAELLSGARDLALQPAIELFRRFGEDFQPETLRGLQEKLRGFGDSV